MERGEKNCNFKSTVVFNAWYLKFTARQSEYLTHLTQNSSAAHVSVSTCILRPCRFCMRCSPPRNFLHHWGATPFRWHIPSINTGCQEFDVLHENAARQSLYMEEKSVLSLQMAHAARFSFSLSMGHYAQSSGSACCVLVMTVCLRFHRESWQPQCVWACQYKPRPQLTRICVSLHNKTFYSLYKKKYHAHTHTY